MTRTLDTSRAAPMFAGPRPEISGQAPATMLALTGGRFLERLSGARRSSLCVWAYT